MAFRSAASLAALLLVLLASAAAEPPPFYTPQTTVGGCERYRLELSAPSRRACASRGYLSAPMCNWEPRLQLLPGVADWSDVMIELAPGKAPAPDGSLLGPVVTLSAAGRKEGAGLGAPLCSAYLTLGALAGDTRAAQLGPLRGGIDREHDAFWTVERVPGTTDLFRFVSKARAAAGWPSRYLGGLHAVGGCGDPRLGAYARTDRAAATSWRLYCTPNRGPATDS